MPAQEMPQVYHSGECEIDVARRELRIRGSPRPLGGRAFGLIEILARSPGQLITKDELMDRIWPGTIVGENTLSVHVSAVRKALGSHRTMLRTESGRGFRLLGEWTVTGPTILPPMVVQNQPSLHREAPVSNLPTAAPRLVGRATDLRRVCDLLSAYRVVTLTGPGGIGKTVLALHAARAVLGEFADGGWVVELASLPDPNLVPPAVSGVLGLRLNGGQHPAAAIAQAIGNKKLLLVLDNCEHVIDAVANLAEMLVRLCPHLTVLATSREVLRIDGEQVYRVVPLEVPPVEETATDGILARSGVALLIARIKQSNFSFAPDPNDLSSIAAICRHLDGIPLAIEFAAARIAALGIQMVAEGLAQRFTLLTTGRRTALPRHRTLRATLDWSYDLLPETDRLLLRGLAIFSGGFTVEAAVAALQDSISDPPSVAGSIVDLVAKSLVVLRSQANPRWYLLESIRAYALEKLIESGEISAVARRHAGYFRDLMVQMASNSIDRLSAGELAKYSGELDNVRAALEWAFSAQGDGNLGVELTVAVVPLFIQMSLLTECGERAERALAVLDDAPATAVARMRLSAALAWSLAYGVGRARETAAAWTKTLELAELLRDTAYRRHALWGLCIDQFNTGNVRTALSYAERFAGLVSNSDDAIERMKADRILATSLHYLGDQNRARYHIEQALSHDVPAQSRSHTVSAGFDLLVSTHYFQARILWLQGCPESALRLVALNVEEGLALGQALSFCSVLGQSACPITLLSGDLDAAERYGVMLAEHTERNPIRLWNIWARCFNGLIAARRGDVDHGVRTMREALDQAADAQFLPRFLLLRGEYAQYIGSAGAVSEAVEIVDGMLAACEARDEGWYLAELLRIKAELLLLRDGGSAETSVEQLLRRSLDEANRQGALAWELRAATCLAHLWIRQGRQGAAIALLRPVYARFTEGFETTDLRAARAILEPPVS
jgi:predicted ATPase/DNA-binding winged helix-turn-helix (wHTH) protein